MIKMTLKKLHILTTFFIALGAMKMYAQETYLDNFSLESYSNNDGTLNWSSNWVEINDNNNATTGFIEVTGNRLEFHWLFVGTEYITRIANLSNATSATLSSGYPASGKRLYCRPLYGRPQARRSSRNSTSCN